MYSKPFSQACENNKDPILTILRDVFKSATWVLEIGSGTGQHSVYFSQALPHLVWQPSDRVENLPGINLWLAEVAHKNLLPSLALDVTQENWPQKFDAVFSANTAHIMSWEIVCRMFVEVGSRLPEGGVFALYGPFNYNGEYTSASNQAFDLYLQSVNTVQGIRDIERVIEVADQAGLFLQKDYAMPANNRLLVWEKECNR